MAGGICIVRLRRIMRIIELSVVNGELAKTEAAIERYLLAFEAGSLPEAVCGERVRNLGTKAGELRARRIELEYEVLDAETPTITRRELAKVRRHDRFGRAGGEESAPAGACGGDPRGESQGGAAVLPGPHRCHNGGSARPAGKGSHTVRVSAPGGVGP